MKCFTFYGSPHSIPTYKVALMMRRIRRSVPLSELPDADAQDVGVFSFPPGASWVLVDSGQIYTGCRQEECCTIVLHRHFPAVRETLDLKDFSAVANRWRRGRASHTSYSCLRTGCSGCRRNGAMTDRLTTKGSTRP